ncbi:MAG TPA: hypothetical protein VF026_24720 [Ktedonobacteraceae bacterium]
MKKLEAREQKESRSIGCGRDHAVTRNHPESGPSTQGRSIGSVRDKSAPTADPSLQVHLGKMSRSFF